jgi:hypothetical protein
MGSSGSPTPIVDAAPGSGRASARGRPATAGAAAWLVGLVLAAMAGVAPAAANAAADTVAFDRTLRQIGAFCARGPAVACARQFFTLADANADGLVDAPEIQAFKSRLQDWTASHGDTLDATDLKALKVGFLLADTIGVENSLLLYDADGDGALSFAEATADLNLDHRPMAQLVQERELVNWPSLRRRFGATAMLFDYLDIR